MKETHLERTIRWMSNDVIVCMAHDSYISAMTLMMTHVSALAGYYSGRMKERPSSDEKEFLNFYNEYFEELPDISTTEKNKRISIVYHFLRNGLIHEHLMKKGTALDKGLSKPAFYIQSNTGDIVINVDSFFADYLKAIYKYSNNVFFNTKPNIKENFIKRAKYLGASDPIV